LSDAGFELGKMRAVCDNIRRRRTMKHRGLLTLAMAAQAMLTAIALLACYAVTGRHAFGTAQLLAMLVSSVIGLLLALLCVGVIERSQTKRTAAQDTDQAETRRALADSARQTQAVIRTALDAFVQTDEDGVVVAWSPQAEARNSTYCSPTS
jgi:PAS domain-containing protein